MHFVFMLYNISRYLLFRILYSAQNIKKKCFRYIILFAFMTGLQTYNYGVMHQIAMGNRSATGAFLYPLPTELEVEISHNSALIHVVQYLCISFVRHGK